ncbi:MAG: SpoIIE family protein phosphatase [Desulfobacterales bacterium]|nr:MAG: SpoIIE family protein phosphatase [Desulfobacterales bacterium]
MTELEVLKLELARLKSEKAAFLAQRKVLENIVALACSPAKEHILKATLQKTLEVAAELTGAENSSLFLLDRDGIVRDSILTRGDTAPDQRSQLIGRVLEGGLAGWVQRRRQTGLIVDTEKDDRWLALPDQPYTVRAALAVPILRSEKLLGILTLLHGQPGHFSTEAAELMQMTASQIGITLENARLYAELDESYRSLEKAKARAEAYSKALDAELRKGQKIQRDFLPDRIPQLPGWEIAACFHPAKQVSGDFYDGFFLPGNRVGVVIADVCDKGVGSALFMALFRSLIRVFSGQISLHGLSISDVGAQMPATRDVDDCAPLKAVALTNDYIAQEHGQECMFATLFLGILNPATGTLAYINAGHEPPVIVGPRGVPKSLSKSRPAVGMMPDFEFKIQQVQLAPGETLLGFTDGVTDARSPTDSLFTKKRLLTLLEHPPASASGTIERIQKALFKHINHAPQADDITMIAVHRSALKKA